MAFQINTCSGVTDEGTGAEGRIAPSVKLNVRTQHHL